MKCSNSNNLVHHGSSTTQMEYHKQNVATLLLHHSLQCYYTDRKYDKNFLVWAFIFLCLFTWNPNKRSAGCPCDSAPTVLMGGRKPSHPFLLSLSLYSIDFFFSASMFKCSWELRAARREDKSVSSGSYTSAVLRRHVLYRVIATPVVQEGKVLLERGRPAAWSVTDLVLTAFLPEARPHHVLHGDVVVVPVGCALAAAVTQQHRLVAVVAESQFANGQLQLPQGAGLRPAGSFSPSGLLVSQATALPPLPVKQGADHLLELALRETLEHRGNWQKGDKTTLMHCFDDCLIFV